MQRHPADLGGDRREDPLDRVEVVGAQVAEQLAARGHDVERVAGAQDGRHGGQVRRAVRVVLGGDDLGGAREREQRVAAAVGRRARVGAAPARLDAHRARGLAARRRRPRRRRRELAGLEAQARVEAGEALDVAEVGAVRHSSSQTSSSASSA